MDPQARSLNQRRALQIAVALAGLVPVIAGGAGVMLGLAFLALDGTTSALTHAAYLSGLLMAIGLSFWSLIPTIERQTAAFRLLTGLVLLGGMARLLTAVRLGDFSPMVAVPLAMELLVTPALCLWQQKIASRIKP